MTKAEERAWEAHPATYEQEDFDKKWDSNEQYREPYLEGYKKALAEVREKALKEMRLNDSAREYILNHTAEKYSYPSGAAEEDRKIIKFIDSLNKA